MKGKQRAKQPRFDVALERELLHFEEASDEETSRWRASVLEIRSRKGRFEAFKMPRLDKDETASAIRRLAEILSIPPGIWEGPLASGADPAQTLLRFRQERLVGDFLRKYPGFSWGNPRAAATKSFLQSERECCATNSRLRACATRGYYPLSIQPVFDRAASIIGRVLGEFDWSYLLAQGKFGKGVTSSTKGDRLHAAYKYRSRPDVTPAFTRRGMWLLSHIPSWSSLIAGVEPGTWLTPLLRTIPGNSVSFVPKNATTDRAIAVEPTINIWFQLAMGGILRDLLKKAGLDLSTQDVNQRLARLGSIDDSLSTIDLERASDTVAWRLVFELLPIKWFEALDALRSHFGTLDGKVFPYHKFSSMGNGFTFELESLIFWALCSSVAQLNGYNSFWVQAYGDDIVVPSGIFDEVVTVLNFSGFTVNSGKSFHRGPFRESCGKDYLRGSDTRPVYLKEVPDNPLSWIKIANNIRRLAHQWADYDGLDDRLFEAYRFACSMVPRGLRRYSISDGYGDVALIRDLDEAKPERARRGWDGWVTKVILTRSKTDVFTERSLVTAGLSKPGRSGNNLPRRSAVEYGTGTMFVPQWRNMGPWRTLT